MTLRFPVIAAFVCLALAGCTSARQATQPDPPATVVVAADAAPGADASTAIATTPGGADAPPAESPTADAVDAGSDATPTEAERDFAALYGNAQDPYDPVADPTLPVSTQPPTAFDPWEPLNRRIHRFNDATDRRLARPLALAYVRVVPRPVRLGVSNFFSNLFQPLVAVNSLLQGKPKQSAQALGRFALNLTLGLGGLLDPATDANLPRRNEDFGQTLGVWGWKRSRYVVLPLFGPRTVRDTVGLVGDAPLSPVRQIDDDALRIFLQGLELVEVRTQLLALDAIREGSTDEYALIRDAWLQRRDYQVFGDRQLDEDTSLPDYLRDDDNPSVPADAMPMMPTDGG